MRWEGVELVSGRQMACIDQYSIEKCGVSGVELMARAGRRVFEAIAERWEELAGLCIVVCCGKGNNGGDGFVVARLLHGAGVRVRVFLAAAEEAVQGDAAQQLAGLKESGVLVVELGSAAGLEPLDAALGEADLVVDALLGTGLRGAVRARSGALIERINHSGVPVVAVDLPSGLEADTGQVHGACVRAELTVSFGLPKIGQLFYPGRGYCGILQLADIGLPPEAIAAAGGRTYLMSAEGMAALIPRRAGDAHKGRCGWAVVVAGSVGMTGAAALSAEAALSAGAGKVSAGVPASLNDILELKLTEVMTRPLPEVRRRRCLALRALGEVLALLQRADCLALGPGLGTYRETVELVRRLVAQVELPLVLDADGLNALVGATDILKERSRPLVLTPHRGEFSRLAGVDEEALAAEPIVQARRFAEDYGLTLVLKGAPTVVALADGRVLVNPTGNAGMATAGAGDVLTGLIAGLIAQGLEAAAAAALGVYVHGRAGDLARDRLGEWGVKAGDIGRALPEAMLSTYAACRGTT